MCSDIKAVSMDEKKGKRWRELLPWKGKDEVLGEWADRTGEYQL